MQIKNIIRMHHESDKIAVQFKQRYITFKELYCKAQTISKLLDKYRDEAIILYLNNSIDYYVAYFAILEIDSVVIPLNNTCTVSNLSAVKNETGSRLIITDSFHKNKLQGLEMDVFYIDTELLETSYLIEKPVLEIPRGTIMLIETSGSINESKLVMLTNDNIFSNIVSARESMGNMGINEKAMVVSFLGSSHGNTVEMLFYLYYRIPVVLYDGLVNISKLLKLLSINKITRVHLVSPLLALLCKTDRKIINRYDLSMLHRISFGSCVFPKELLPNALERFPNVMLIQDYGLTEASPLVTSLGEKDWLLKFGSIGKKLTGIDLKIVKSDDEGEVGELLIRGENVTRGYFKRNNQQLFDNGWLKTGDLVYCDEEGYLFFKGRKGRKLKCNAYSINPEDVENVIMTLVDVENVLVYAVQDSVRENILCADVEIVKSSLIDEKKIQSYCAEFLPTYKVPQIVNIVESLERTSTGKVKIKSSCS